MVNRASLRLHLETVAEASDALIVRTSVVEVQIEIMQLAFRLGDAVVQFGVGHLVDGA